MNRYQPGPPASALAPPQPRVAVLLCNLGTPDEPTTAAVRRYLAEFLSDPRVVEIPAWAWQPILHGIVLRTRPAKSAAKYASIWTSEGSPLKVWTERQAKYLQGYLGERGKSVTVRAAMRYGSPGIARQLSDLSAQGVRHFLILSAYPQYSGTTTASLADAVFAWAARQRVVPELRFVNAYPSEPGYIAALAQSVKEHWQREGRRGHLLMSFHGVPARTVALGDPYQRDCEETARLLAARLGLESADWTLAYQSRFGKAKWLEPSTSAVLHGLAARGSKTIDVICPGFTSDCLETLEEIAQEGRADFLGAGGQDFGYVPCLNERGDWLAALTQIAARHLDGWV